MQNKNTMLAVIEIVLGLAVSIASVIYIFTEAMIPGLIPLGTALLMVPLWLQQREHKAVAILLTVAFVLNMLAGIIQIWTAILG